MQVKSFILSVIDIKHETCNVKEVYSILISFYIDLEDVNYHFHFFTSHVSFHCTSSTLNDIFLCHCNRYMCLAESIAEQHSVSKLPCLYLIHFYFQHCVFSFFCSFFFSSFFFTAKKNMNDQNQLSSTTSIKKNDNKKMSSMIHLKEFSTKNIMCIEKRLDSKTILISCKMFSENENTMSV